MTEYGNERSWLMDVGMIIPSGRFIVNTRALAWSHVCLQTHFWLSLDASSRMLTRGGEALEAKIKTLWFTIWYDAHSSFHPFT